MVKKKDNNYYISKVIIHLENVVSYLKNVDYDTFFKRKLLQSAVCFELIQIYENANNITDDILLTINNLTDAQKKYIDVKASYKDINGNEQKVEGVY